MRALRALTDWLVAECTRLGVDIVLGREVDAAAVAAARADGWDVVLATGSAPGGGPVPRLDRRRGAALRPAVHRSACPVGRVVVVDALQVLAGASLPEGAVVVDDPVGDWVGVAVAEWLAGRRRAGSVTLVTPDPVAGTLLARTGDLADANVRLQRAGVTRRLRTRITALASDGVAVEEVWTGAADRLPAAVLVDCGHRLPDDALWRQLGDPDHPACRRLRGPPLGPRGHPGRPAGGAGAVGRVRAGRSPLHERRLARTATCSPRCGSGRSRSATASSSRPT